MKFTRETSTALAVRSVADTAIRVGSKTYERTIVMTPHTVFDDWPEKAVGDLDENDFEAVFSERPEVVLLGTGAESLFPPRELTFSMARRGIGLEVMDTRAAARTFNVLASEGRRVAAILYL